MTNKNSFFETLYNKKFEIRISFSKYLAICSLAYFTYSQYQTILSYENRMKKMQMDHKDNYLARFQTFFIEAFNSPFTLAINFDEGFGLLNKYLTVADRKRLIMIKLNLERKTKDYSLMCALGVPSIIYFPIPYTMVIGGYLYQDSVLTTKMEKELSHPEFEVETFISNSPEWKYRTYFKQTSIVLGLYSLLKLLKH